MRNYLPFVFISPLQGLAPVM